MMAHELARLARFSRGSVWLDEPPEVVINLLIKDVTVIFNKVDIVFQKKD